MNLTAPQNSPCGCWQLRLKAKSQRLWGSEYHPGQIQVLIAPGNCRHLGITHLFLWSFNCSLYLIRLVASWWKLPCFRCLSIPKTLECHCPAHTFGKFQVLQLTPSCQNWVSVLRASPTLQNSRRHTAGWNCLVINLLPSQESSTDEL